MIWILKEKLDIHFLILVDFVLWMKLFFLRTMYFRNEFQYELSARHNEIQVISNGPSSISYQDQIDITLPTIFMNFGFKHPKFADCHSPYLIIVDKKLATGEWQIDMLQEATVINPRVKIFLGGKLLKCKKLRKIGQSNENIFFFFNDLSTFTSKKRIKSVGSITIGGGATEASIVLATQLGGKVLRIFGFDGNNVLLGILGRDTHFYGHDSLKNWHSAEFCARELRFLSYFLNKNIYLADILNRAGIRAINYSPTSIMTMYERLNNEVQ